MTSDHFHPWWHDNAYGNFTWIWMAAAAERTKRMQFITGATAPVYRYHPAIIATALHHLTCSILVELDSVWVVEKPWTNHHLDLIGQGHEQGLLGQKKQVYHIL